MSHGSTHAFNVLAHELTRSMHFADVNDGLGARSGAAERAIARRANPA
jgi:hypothetical protein